MSKFKRSVLAAVFALVYFFWIAYAISRWEFAPDIFRTHMGSGLLAIGAVICGAGIGWQIGSTSRFSRAGAVMWLLWPLAVYGWEFMEGYRFANPLFILFPPLFITIVWWFYRWVMRGSPE